MAYKFNINRGEEILLKAASIGAAILGVVAVYTFYKNNIWKPKIVVNDVDFQKGVANLTINNRPFVLRGDSAYLIAYDWGVRFGFTPTPDGKRVYDRIEVIKRNMVQKVIKKADDAKNVAFTGFNEDTYWNDAFDGGKPYDAAFTGSDKAITEDVWGVKDGEGFSIFVDK